MNEDLIQKLLQYLQRTEDFGIVDQMPEIILQVLRYEKISSFVIGSLMLILVGLSISMFFYFLRHPNRDKYESRSPLSGLGMYVSVMGAIICFILLFASIDNLMKIYLAPKYYSIDLIKKTVE